MSIFDSHDLHYYTALRENRRKLVEALAIYYIDRNQNENDPIFLQQLRQYIIYINQGRHKLNTISESALHVYKRKISQHTDVPLPENITLAFQMFEERANEFQKNRAIVERRRLFILPVLTTMLSLSGLFIIAAGITIGATQIGTIVALIFFLFLGSLVFIMPQAYLRYAPKNTLKARREKIDSLSLSIQRNEFEPDTFKGCAFVEQHLEEVLDEKKPITKLKSRTTIHPDRNWLWHVKVERSPNGSNTDISLNSSTLTNTP
ncbi:MAG: hypothetical protein Q8R83_06375 [Legionellaceae bacterium]|nr:hypothetical protein [Legionellaceae bacterium]